MPWPLFDRFKSLLKSHKTEVNRSIRTLDSQNVLSSEEDCKDHNNSTLVEYPELPDDILLTIFKRLSTADRVPLGLVSKRFRELDFKAGHRIIEEIYFIMEDESDEINVKISSGTYSFKTTPSSYFEMTSIGNHNFFKDATVDTLRVCVGKKRAANLSHVPSSLFNSITYKKLYLVFLSSADFSMFLLSFFERVTNKEVNLEKILLYSECVNYQNLSCLEEALQLLPRSSNLIVKKKGFAKEITFFERLKRGRSERNIMTDDPNRFLLNGSTMLHLITTADNVHLESVHCTAVELLDAFETVCDSKIDSKKVKMFYVVCKMEDLIDLAKEKGIFQIVEHQTTRSLVDLNRGYRMDVLEDFSLKKTSTKCRAVSISKVDHMPV